MSDIALANGATGAVRAQVEKTKSDQQMEVAMVEAMLRGEPMMDMSATPAGGDAAMSAPKPTSAAKPAPAAPATPKAPKPAPDPHAGMNMTNL